MRWTGLTILPLGLSLAMLFLELNEVLLLSLDLDLDLRYVCPFIYCSVIYFLKDKIYFIYTTCRLIAIH